MNTNDTEHVDNTKNSENRPDEVIIALFLSGLLSVTLFAALVVTWYLLPKWRTLQHYMTIMRIFYETIFLCICYSYFQVCEYEVKKRCGKSGCRYYYFSNCKSSPYWRIFVEVAKIDFLLSICWCLSSLVVAYIRIVLRYTGVVIDERKRAMTFTHVSAAAIYSVYKITGWYAYNNDDHIANCGSSTSLFFTLTMFNWFLFFKMTKGSLIGFKTSLGVALFCDMVTIVLMFFADCTDGDGVLDKSIVKVLRMILILTTAFKIIPQCLLILASHSTRTEWRKYWLRRRRHHQSNEL